MKKLLLYANYFYPEVASLSQLYTELFRELSNDFQVTVICAIPCYTGVIDEEYLKHRFYNEEYHGMKIIRVRVSRFTKSSKISRVKHILCYFFNSVLATLRVGRQDVVFTCSQPPVLGGLLGVIGKIVTRGKLVYNIQDFNPEQTIAVGYSKNKIILNTMMFFDKFSCRMSDLVAVVGRDMQKTLENRFLKKKVPQSVVINNWINEDEVYPLDKNDSHVVEFKRKHGLEGKFVIMYSGNVGLFYDFENIITIIEEFKDKKDVVFAIVGEGAVRDFLSDYVKDHFMENVVFIPYQDKEQLVYSLNAADVHLVMNAKGIKGVSVPSKIYGILAINAPIIGILEEGTEAWNIIENSDCGILVHAGNYEEIVAAFNEVITQKEDFVQKHLKGRDYLLQRYTKAKSVEHYKEALSNF